MSRFPKKTSGFARQSANRVLKNQNDDILFLFTANYPFGEGESFIGNELETLSQHFREIRIFPQTKKGPERKLPENCKVVFDSVPFNSKKVLLMNALAVRFAMRHEAEASTNPAWYKENKRDILNLLLQAFHKADFVKTQIDDAKGRVVFYSFWMDVWALAMSLLKRKNQIPGYVCRVNGYDLFDHRRKGDSIPFKAFNMQYANKVITTSKNAANYLVDQFPQHRKKVEVSYLGVNDHGTNSFPKDDVFVIASCSWVTPVKRVLLIPEILKQLDFPVKWLHIGDGNQMEDLKKQVAELPDNVDIELTGSLPVEEIMQKYQTQPIHLFMLLSESEGGCPVAIQEALSFGIPIIGTAVGGITEMLNEHTGMAVDAEVDAQKVADQIREFRASERNAEAFRVEVKEYWKQHFAAETNYLLLVNQLKNSQ